MLLYPFKGNFDGNNKTISIYYTGLFGTIGEGGIIKNLTLNGTIGKGGGALAYSNYGTITDCCNRVNFTNTASAWGNAGITSYNYGLVEKCCNYGTISGF